MGKEVLTFDVKVEVRAESTSLNTRDVAQKMCGVKVLPVTVAKCKKDEQQTPRDQRSTVQRFCSVVLAPERDSRCRRRDDERGRSRLA